MNDSIHSENFNQFYYWFISNAPQATIARARNDLPMKLITLLSGDELETAKQLIIDKLDKNEGDIIHIKALVGLGDKSAIPAIKNQYRRYKDKNKTRASDLDFVMRDFSVEMNVCLSAIKTLRNKLI